MLTIFLTTNVRQAWITSWYYAAVLSLYTLTKHTQSCIYVEVVKTIV